MRKLFRVLVRCRETTLLGIVPGGTGNVLSIELGIPQTPEEAIRLLVSPDAQVQGVDIGQAGKRSFLLRAYVGFDAERIQQTSREVRDRYGKMAHLIAALRAIPESEPMRYRLTLDDKDVECEGFTCIVQNAANMGVRGPSLVPKGSVGDCLLDVIVIYGLDPLSEASALSSIVDAPLDPERFHRWQAKEITIATDSPQPVIGDGEAWGKTPITIKVLPSERGARQCAGLVPAGPSNQNSTYSNQVQNQSQPLSAVEGRFFCYNGYRKIAYTGNHRVAGV